MSDLNFATQSGLRPRTDNTASGVPWRILVISIVIFGLTIVIYAGMQFGYIPYLSSQIDKVDSQFTQLSKSFNDQQQKDFLNFYSQLYNIKSLSGNHAYPSKVFDFIETSLYPSVKLTNLQVTVSTGEIRLEGNISDYDSLSNQLAVFKSNSNVASMSLDSSRKVDPKDGGGIFFSIKLNMNKDFFATP